MEDTIVRAEEDFARGQPLVKVPADWARELYAARRVHWTELYGHAYGESDIEPGSEIERKAQTVWLAGGGPDLIWVQGHDGATVGFIERVERHTTRYRFCG